MELPTSMSFDVNLYSSVPAGCSTGTSAAVSVALIGALDLLTPGRLTSYEVAALAQRVETDKLGLQCGIQDQIASAYGGICHIEMFDYPHASVSRVELPNSLWWELERRLVLVFLGQAHSSSEVHGKVIEQLEAHGNPGVLARLRDAARAGKNALAQGDFKAYGEALIRNTQAQQELHEALVSEAAREVINLARAYGALGWKINGAGGEGGSLTLLFGPEGASKRAFINHLPTLNPAYEVIPTYLSRVGLRRWESA